MNEELRWMAGEAECVKLCLDKEGVPTEDEGGVLSLWGRVLNRTKPLSDIERAEIADKCFGTVSQELYLQIQEFGRAIEAKVRGEK